MSEALTPPNAAEQMLEELAQLDLQLARKVQARAMAAEDDEAINSLSRTYQRIARSLRQTLALKDKVAREHRADPEVAARVDYARKLATRRRTRQLYEAVEKIAWDEYENDDGVVCGGAKAADRLAQAPDFLDAPFAELIERIRDELGLHPDEDEAHPGEGREDGEGDDADPDWRSSA